MLPTDKNGAIQRNRYNSMELIRYSPDPNCKQEHLYLTSDEEIKEGDWYLNTIDNSIKQSSDWIYVSTCKKIVATTNPELWGGIETVGKRSLLIKRWGIPKIDSTFIEDYVKAYNEGILIKEVIVEYGSITNTRNHTEKYQIDFPKLNPDGSVIIHPIEENPIEQILAYMVKHKYNKTNPVLYGYIASYINVKTKNKS